jgi:hypothetical protein
VVDWNKEVKLSDLIGRKQKPAEEAIPPAPVERSAHELQPAA